MNRKNIHHKELDRRPVQGRWGDLIRFSIVSIWTLYVITAHFSSSEVWLPMAGYALVSAFMIFRKDIIPNAFVSSILPLVVDAVFLTYVIHLFGSITSQIAIYYILTLIGYHVTEPAPVRRTALLLTIGGYATILGLEYFRVIPNYADFGVESPQPSALQYLTSFFKVAIAIGGSYLFLSVASRKIDTFITTEKSLKETTRRSQAQATELQKQIESAQRLESLGRLAGGVAHDFNNLLTGILTNAQFLKDELQLNPRGINDVEKIITATRQASLLTSQLLTFGRKQVVRPKILNLNRIVVDSLGAIKGATGPKIRVRNDFCSDLGNVKVDASLMKQVILNLAVNARDAMPEGGTLSISTDNTEITPENFKDFPELSLGPHVELIISDTGKGISPENIEKIFDPFFTTKHGEHATGLGLSSVYGVIRQANGHVHARSTIGVGTSICIILPRIFESAASNTAPQAVIAGSKETILLVEDEEMVRTSVTRILKRKNYNVLSATSGEEAIEIFDNSADHVSLVVTDVIMTGITGEVVADHIHQSHPGLPVLFMSGYTEDAISNRGILKEGTAFLPKPFSAEELLVAVAKTLKNTPKSHQ